MSKREREEDSAQPPAKRTKEESGEPAQKFKQPELIDDDERTENKRGLRSARINAYYAGRLEDNETTDRLAGLDGDGDDDDDDAGGGSRMSNFKGEEDAVAMDFDGNTRIMPFNMKDEMEDGHFDAEGNYFEKKMDPDLERDDWLASLQDRHDKGKKEQSGVHVGGGTAGGAVFANMSKKSASEKAQDEAIERMRPEEALAKIFWHLKPRENVLACMRRLKNEKKSKEINEITTLAHKVMEVDTNAYHLTKEAIKKMLPPSLTRKKREGEARVFEYKFTRDDASTDKEVHGPFSEDEMADWGTYFKGAGVVVRQLKPEESAEWVSYDSVF